MSILVSDKVLEKLTKKHGGISHEEIEECFANRDPNAKALTDVREQHHTDPPTMWIISETDRGVRYKLVFILGEDGDIRIKTVYPPNAEEIRIFNKYAYE